jgi:hypothetical protein
MVAKKINDKHNIKDDIVVSIVNLNNLYKTYNQDIFYSFEERYEAYINDEPKLIDDEKRLNIIKSCVRDEIFKTSFTSKFYKDFLDFNNSLNDPKTIGYLILKDELGTNFKQFLSQRNSVNLFFPNVYPDDPSSDMSDSCYSEYHKNRIHVVKDSTAIYKNRAFELCVYESFHILYFVFKKDVEESKNKWLLDDIQICPKDEEETFDLKLIGESKPLKYFEPYCENSDPNF